MTLGKTLEKRLKKLGIHTRRDILFYFPFRFDDFSRVTLMKDAGPGAVITVRGAIELIKNRRSRNRRMILTEALVSDESGSMKVIWFNQPFLTKNLKNGERVSLSGKMSDHAFDLTLINPAYEKIRAGDTPTHTARLVPVYRLTEGLTQKQFRTVVKAALDSSSQELAEWLPVDLIRVENLLDLKTSIEEIHFPQDSSRWERARERLAFDELFVLQLAFRTARKNLEQLQSFSCAFPKDETQDFIAALPFRLTAGQRIAVWKIVQDLARPRPMNRLLDGDVGSGKTIVSAIATFVCARGGLQSAYMAPTEILARQTYEAFVKLFEQYGVGCALLTGKQIYDSRFTIHETIPKKQVLSAIREGEIAIVIGTHALVQPSVKFSKLALAIVDEQHRFGVNQRKALREKNESGEMPHLLSMTATPIPRSLALALYGDLDVSVLPEGPKGRKKVVTKIVPPNYREWTTQFIRKEIQKGRQAFVICPLIEVSDVLGVRSTTQEFERLKTQVFPDLKIGMLHGKMKGKEKEEAMNSFTSGAIDILVSTSVIEVGIDVPNTTVMLIEGAERFGLAQLHQFRGRVGRGEHQSYCFLFPSESASENTVRLEALVNCSDGFKLAEEDLKHRGSGDLLGERQSGIPALKLASLSDVHAIQKAREWAEKIFPRLEHYPALQNHLAEVERDVHLE